MKPIQKEQAIVYLDTVILKKKKRKRKEKKDKINVKPLCNICINLCAKEAHLFSTLNTFFIMSNAIIRTHAWQSYKLSNTDPRGDVVGLTVRTEDFEKHLNWAGKLY